MALESFTISMIETVSRSSEGHSPAWHRLTSKSQAAVNGRVARYSKSQSW